MNPAAAQTVDVAELEKCAGLSPDTQKLACYEALTAANRARARIEAGNEPGLPADEQRPELSRAERPVESPATADVSAAPVGQATAANASPRPAVASDGPSPERPASVPSDAAGSQAAAEPASEPVDPLENWGVDEDSEPDVAHATVTRVTKTRYGELEFHFANGQVWRQQEKRYFPYPRDRAFDVTLSTGMMGEYRLQVEGAGRRATIKRVQ